MFASPTYVEIRSPRNISNKKVSFDRLEFTEEFKRIKESIVKSKIEISVHKIQGTKYNF